MLQYEGMYIYFPTDSNDYYYFIRVFEDDKASGMMIQSNYEFKELYQYIYKELEDKRYFTIEQFGRQVLFNSHLMIDFKGAIHDYTLKLVGSLKDGRMWKNGEAQEFIFVPSNRVDSYNQCWIVTREKDPLSIYNKEFNLYLKKQYIRDTITYKDIPFGDLIIKDQQVIGYFKENQIIMLENMDNSN